MQTRARRPEGWLRKIMMGEDVAKTVEATPSDPVLAQQIVESKGSANQAREPIRYERPRAVGQPRHHAASQPRLLVDPVLAPIAAREQRLENRRRTKNYEAKRKERRCLQCEGLPHRRPEVGKCRCGKRFEPDGVGVEIAQGSSLASFDSW